jgi:hypothetical protein
MKTYFTSIKVPILEGKEYLFVDGNSKITSNNGTYSAPKPNAFSLPSVSTCPLSTPACRSSCYVSNLKIHSPETYVGYESNERVIHQILMSSSLIDISSKEFGEWIESNCQGGFRWHVSGDVFNLEYASWIVKVCNNSPNVQHWIYTRTFPLVEILMQAINLVVNVSCDEDNYEEAKLIQGDRLCYLSRNGYIPEDLPENSIIFPDYSLRGRDLEKPTEHPWWKQLSTKHKLMCCPTDFFGQSEVHRCGPCKKCLKKS